MKRNDSSSSFVVVQLNRRKTMFTGERHDGQPFSIAAAASAQKRREALTETSLAKSRKHRQTSLLMQMPLFGRLRRCRHCGLVIESTYTKAWLTAQRNRMIQASMSSNVATFGPIFLDPVSKSDCAVYSVAASRTSSERQSLLVSDSSNIDRRSGWCKHLAQQTETQLWSVSKPYKSKATVQ